MRTRLGLFMLCVLSAAGVCSGSSAPGNPRLLGCRSPEKETFTCWWEPGDDGVLPTEYRLYYRTERLEGLHECPDYVSAGENSCFFDKHHTSFWVAYELTVVATNALGNASSDFLIPDIMKYVKPYPPLNVTVLVNGSLSLPNLQVKWKSPPSVDVKTGWVTPKYELRFKQNDEKEWKNIETGMETNLNVYYVEPGGLYMVEVRCKIDHGSWSEWSKTTFAKVPEYRQAENQLLYLVFIFSLIPLLATIFFLVLKRKLVMQWLLPPVPGPKIRGVDVQLLKGGRSEDVVNALTSNRNFPPMTTWKDQVEEYLLVSDSDEWRLPNSFIARKKKDCFIIPAGLHSEIQRKESITDKSTWENTLDSRGKTDRHKSSNASLSQSNLSDTEPMLLPTEEQDCQCVEKPAVQPLTNSSYVDIQQNGNSWESSPTQADYSKVEEVNGETVVILNNERDPHCSDVEGNVEGSAPDDYSRVKEVNVDLVFLQKHEPTDSYCKKTGECIKATDQTLIMPHESKGFCSETFGNGYVDSVPAFSS